MQKHTKIYFDAMGYYPTEHRGCEVCGTTAVDIHHIEARGMGGSSNPEKDSIFNLMALCRSCHDKFGDKVKYKRWLKVLHLRKIMQRGSLLLGVFHEVNFNDNEIIFTGEGDAE